MDFINSQISQYPDLAEAYTTLGELHEKKLWHQLSIALESFLSDPKNVKGENMYNLYDGFISLFEARLNQIKFAGLVSSIVRTINPQNAIDFVTRILKNRTRIGVDASMCLDMDIVMLNLKVGNIEGAQAMIETAKEQLASINPSESVIFSKYYRAMSDYRKIVGPPNEFYNSALMFLSYTSVEDMLPDDRYTLAVDMALASITGENIYNFGEVLATPILSYLKNTPSEWLLHIVEAMNIGNVEQFHQVVNEYKTQYFAQPVLNNTHENVVKQKIVLLCIVNVAFERHSHDRVIKFEDIAQRAGIAVDQVEWVLMRAMSLGLLKGSLDEVEGVVSVTWVQPRVLDRDQIQQLNAQLGLWVDKTKNALLTIEDQTAELF